MNDSFQLPVRKRLRSGEYPYSGHSYFITICTAEKKPLFGHINFSIPAHVVLNDLGIYADTILSSYDIVNHHIVMPNHIHFIATIGEGDYHIDQLVRNFKSRVSRHNGGGSIWQKSYYDIIIRDENQYYHFAHYITYNAETWRDDKYFVEK